MIRCVKCLIPTLRPDQIFTDGVCNACTNFEIKKKIDWKSREKIFFKLIEDSKRKNSEYDCIVPSSGGKDSTFQAIFLKKLGLRVLVVTATTCDLSKLGRFNIENLKRLGFDTIEISPNKIVRKKINKLCLELIGDISWPEHLSIFTFPIHVACKFNIPIICWGENPQSEYGGPVRKSGYELDRDWLEEFGGLLGLRIEDLQNHGDFNENDLAFYKYPEIEIIKKLKIQGIFLGYFFNWNSFENFTISKANGFKDYGKPIENGYFSFEKLDNYQHVIHDYFKFIKYGFGRATDQLSLCVRYGKIQRDDALLLVKKMEGSFPKSGYLGKSLKDILGDIEMTENEFIKICDKFTNKNIFKCSQNSILLKQDNGNLILK